MSATTTPEAGRLTADLCKQIQALSRDTKEQLLIWLQEELDGGPYIGDLPHRPADPAGEVQETWKNTIARRIEEMRTGRVEAIDAQGAAARLLQKMIRKYGP